MFPGQMGNDYHPFWHNLYVSAGVCVCVSVSVRVCVCARVCIHCNMQQPRLNVEALNCPAKVPLKARVCILIAGHFQGTPYTAGSLPSNVL